jgi:ribokinase
VNGVLAAALDAGMSLREALTWAVGAGSVAVTRPGACAAMPTRAEVLALLAPA